MKIEFKSEFRIRTRKFQKPVKKRGEIPENQGKNVCHFPNPLMSI